MMPMKSLALFSQGVPSSRYCRFVPIPKQLFGGLITGGIQYDGVGGGNLFGKLFYRLENLWFTFHLENVEKALVCNE